MKEDFMRRAVALALDNVMSGRGGPFGAVVVKDKKIIAEGTNLVTSTNDPTAHAEVVAIRAACRALNTFQLLGCDLYTSCEPCPMCLGAIYWARPAQVFFAATASAAADAGFDDSFIKTQICLPYAQQQMPIAHVAHKESLAPFQAWKAKADKIVY